MSNFFSFGAKNEKKPWRETEDWGKLFLWLVKSFWLNYAYQLALWYEENTYAYEYYNGRTFFF